MLLGTTCSVASEQLSWLVYLSLDWKLRSGTHDLSPVWSDNQTGTGGISWPPKPRLTPPYRSGRSSFLLWLNYVTQRLWVILSTTLSTDEASYVSFNGGSGSKWVRTISDVMRFFTETKAPSHSAVHFHAFPCSKSLLRGLRVVARIGNNLR